MNTLRVALLSCALSASVFALDPTTKDIPPNISYPSTIDDWAGLGADRDDEQIKFSFDLIEEVRRTGGILKVATWKWRGRAQVYAMRRNADGSWSGPNPPMGYYTSRRTESIWEMKKPRR